MEINAWTIYLWQQAGPIAYALGGVGAVTALIAGLGIVFAKILSLLERDEDEVILGIDKACQLPLVVGLLVMGVASLIPSSNTIAMMVVIPEIAQSKVIQQDVPDLYNAAVEALKEQLKKKED